MALGMLLPARAVHRFSEADVPYAHKVFVLLPDGAHAANAAGGRGAARRRRRARG